MGVSQPSYLVLDIETVPDRQLWGVRGDAPEAALDRSFPPTYAHRIVCLGSMWLGADYRLRRLDVLGSGLDERDILERFSSFVDAEQPALVTFNGRAFDLPVIALRALRSGVPLGWYYRGRALRRPAERRDDGPLDGHIDLSAQLADHGAVRSASLDVLARLIGLPGKIGVDGSQVEDLHAAGLQERIETYCLVDVAQTALLFLRFRLLQGVLDRDGYRDAARGLTAALGADGRLGELCGAIDGERLLSAA